MTRNPLLAVLTLCVILSGCTPSKKPAEEAATSKVNVSDAMGCGRFFFKQKPPQIIDEKLAAKTDLLCYRSFALEHSGISRTPIWTAEALDKDILEMAYRVDRIDTFHPEDRLPKDRRATKEDYVGSGYDRGHMVPAADMPTLESQHESFSLANMVPQAGDLNRGAWGDLERDVRKQADLTPVFVVTGPVFKGKALWLRKNRVLVPSHIYKAMLIPKYGATVYVATNQDDAKWSSMSVDEFARFSGIDPFPALDTEKRKVNIALLPLPSYPRQTYARNASDYGRPPAREIQKTEAPAQYGSWYEQEAQNRQQRNLERYGTAMPLDSWSERDDMLRAQRRARMGQ